MRNETVRVLLVEDNDDDAGLIRRLLGKVDGADVKLASVPSTSEGLKRLEAEGADLLLLDYRLPGEDGISFLRRLSESVELPPVIVLSGQGDERVAVEAMRSGAADYLRKDALTADVLGQTARHAIDQFQLEEEARHFDEQIMLALGEAAESKDATTGGHLHRLTHLTALLGHELGLNDHELLVLRRGALLHDIGKLAMGTAILCKPGPLTDDEWEEVRQHPLVGERICRCLQCGRHVRPIIRHHHERWDGGGYPDGLAGAGIPFLARIVAVVDAFDAMSSNRPYRRALKPAEIVRRLRDGAGRQWDPDITWTFLELIEREGLDLHLTGNRRRRHAA